jgi:DNA polymerase-4
MGERAIVHLNVIGFKAAVAVAKDKTLRGRPLVIAGATAGRALSLDCSREAVQEGITPGMPLAVAERRVKDLTILPLDLPAYEKMNNELERVASLYAPAWENDKAGNLYLDITGTARLFGPPVDCSSHIMREIMEHTDIRPATAVASNKLVSKVATRTIRPIGLIQVNAGTEPEFLAHQDIRLLPGMGPNLLRTARITGIREIGEVASLSVNEAISIFGKNGTLLRSMAQGIDGTRVEENRGERHITQQADFEEDVIEEIVIKGAVESLVEHGGFLMRRDKLGATIISLAVKYSDGVRQEGHEKARSPWVLDKEISVAALRIFKKIAIRRLRIRTIGLSLYGLIPLGYEADLFESEKEIKKYQFQKAVDGIRSRYGIEKITTGLVLEASQAQGGKRLLTTGGGYAN